MQPTPAFAFSHTALDLGLPYLGPFENGEARIFLQPDEDLWLVHWEANTAAGLIRAVDQAVQTVNLHQSTLQIEYVPPEFEGELLNAGYERAGEWVDAWIDDLPAHHPAPQRRFPVRIMLSNEVMAAARISAACSVSPRGAAWGQPQWVEEWAMELSHHVFLGFDGNRPVGVLFAGLYGYDLPQGVICWIHELAVLPGFQNHGVGRELLLSALQWGNAHKAQRAFISVDLQNEKAVNLYQSIGFVMKPGRGQINLQCELP